MFAVAFVFRFATKELAENVFIGLSDGQPHKLSFCSSDKSKHTEHDNKLMQAKT